MNIKGIFFVVTKDSMTKIFGEERWKEFMTKLAQKEKYFSSVIMSITPIPAEKLIVIFDEMCREFFDNDKSAYEMFGKVGAKYALSPEGPYKSFMLTKELKQFVEISLPKIYSMYFDGGAAIARLENNVAHIKVTGIDMKNVYFEQMLRGYFQKAIKMFGKKSTVKTIRSLAAGDKDVYFQYELRDA